LVSLPVNSSEFLTLIQRHTQYNEWANARMIATCTEAGNEACNREFISSFPSVNKTLMHIRDAQWVWSMRLHGRNFSQLPFAPFPACNPWEEVLQTSSELCRDAASFTEAQLQEEVTYQNMKGISCSNLRYNMFLHCINHSSYHRGQVITLLRMAGATQIPSTDLIEFLAR